MSGRTRFDRLAKVYEDLAATPFRRHLEMPSVFAALGDVRGSAVLDLGCGAGDYARALARRGATKVVGHDRSLGMIEHARGRERTAPLGIRYITDELRADLHHAFDVVLSVYVMPYATTRDELAGICASAAWLLRRGGLFVTLPIHPDFPYDEPDYYRHYGFRMYSGDRPADGSPVTLELLCGGHQESVTARYWSHEALAGALSDTGFTELAFPPFQVTPAGVREQGPDFWDGYLTRPHATIIAARSHGA
ncbi:class I SAM-dependent methyltransferase [Actinomadura rubrisoli]|uniref:Class I SAM-dependent methyltransferase n=1 Tax=Actinomadura rubrisoli TaxID=2530368 RepID=A0A4R5A022_9ACTN|nr:class I SAM-dependent methyltransferase [Actinomadura rubrisoli]TDD63779.1 class I SAM-dependent methyltransferase [Actinomadura rubrisoli]